MKTCNDCQLQKPVEEFYRNPENRDGRSGHCKSCHKIRVEKTLTKRDAEKKRLLQDKYNLQRREYRRNPEVKKRHQHQKSEKRQRRVFHIFSLSSNLRHKGRGIVTARELWIIARRQRLICPLSGLFLTRKTISLDHIVPISQGGSHSAENIQLVHVIINKMKLNHSDQEFIDMCKRITAFTSNHYE